MMRLAVVLALAVAVSAGGCYLKKDYACVKKDAVKCGGDWCHGHCAVEHVKACDTKVSFKTVCEDEDFCKEITTPCGHDGSAKFGLFCGATEECIKEQECEIVSASKLVAYKGWKSKLVSGGLFEVCKDVFSCEAVDPWDADDDEVEVVCTKEYKIVEDMDCDSFWKYESVWGVGGVKKSKFFKLNSGFDCGKKLVGRLICVEADIKFKTVKCGGVFCDEGYECATKTVCKEVPVKTPICATKPVYTCLLGSSKATVCGSKVCSKIEKCEVFSTKVCPPAPVPVPVPVPHPNPVPSPVYPPPSPVYPPPSPVHPPPAPVHPPPSPTTPASPKPVVPLADVSSSSFSNKDGTQTATNAVSNGGDAISGAFATGDNAVSDSYSFANGDGLATAFTTTASINGKTAKADAGATSNGRRG